MVLLVGFISAGNVFAQSAPLSKGQKQLNFGLGLGGWGLPVYVGLDFAVHNDITIGPEIFFNLEDNNNGLGAAFRADYHFNRVLSIPQEFDFYAGLNINHYFYFDSNYNKVYDSPTNLDFQLGGRWYWSQWGLNLEFGGGKNHNGGKFGLSLKF